MKLQKIEKKMSNIINGWKKDIKIEDIDKHDLALICLLTRFIIEMENMNKINYNWNILHSLLHLNTTNNSNKSIFQSVIYFLNKSKEKDFSYINEKLGSYMEEYSDKYWDFKVQENLINLNKKKYTIISIKLINPYKKIYGIKAKKAKSVLYFFSYDKLKKFHVYNLEIKQLENNLKHKRYFLQNFKDISNFVTLNQNTLNPIIKEIIAFYYERYPKNMDNFKGIENVNESKFWYILKDILIGSSPIKDISFQNKLRICEKYYENNIENEKLDLNNKIKLSKLPFIKDWKYKLNEKNNSITTYYSLKKVSNFTTNEYTFCYIKYLSNIFSNFQKIESPLFLGKYTNKTLLLKPAGYGKSTEIINFIKNNSSYDYIIFTPTKKAEEVFKKISSNKNVEISQIKKMEYDFTKNKRNPKFVKGFEKNKIIFFDEISMYDFKTWEIINELKDFNQLNFIGDPWQIPPIYENGWSHLLEKISNESILPDKKYFKKNHRISEIKNENHKEKIINLLDDTRKGNLKNIHKWNKKYKNFFTSYNNFTELFDLLKKDEFINYKIIVPENNGVLGVKNLSRILKRDNKSTFKEHDSVIWIEQNNDGDFYPGQNLEIKKIDVDEKNEKEKFTFSNSLKYDHNIGSDYPFSLGVLNGHKAQGQSIDKALVIITNSNIIDIRWFYTAISRIKKNIHIFYPLDYNFDNLKQKNILNREEKQDLLNFIKQMN